MSRSRLRSQSATLPMGVEAGAFYGYAMRRVGLRFGSCNAILPYYPSFGSSATVTSAESLDVFIITQKF